MPWPHNGSAPMSDRAYGVSLEDIVPGPSLRACGCANKIWTTSSSCRARASVKRWTSCPTRVWSRRGGVRECGVKRGSRSEAQVLPRQRASRSGFLGLVDNLKGDAHGRAGPWQE